MVAVVAVLSIVLVFQNTESVETKIFLATVAMPRAVLLAVTFVLGVVVGLDGVLYVGDRAVPGAREALRECDRRGLPKRFVTNTTTRTAGEVVEKLQRLGFEEILFIEPPAADLPRREPPKR